MDSEKFKIAQTHYDAQDWRAAARGFLESTEAGTPIGNGPAYHLAGNSFMRLKRYSDAVTVYEHALRDDTYLRQAAVETNLANAYLKLGEYSLAIAHYQAAIDEPDAKALYKCYQGMGLAFMEQEEFHQAALSYRRAAVCKDNPEIGRALVNLGIALMALGRPADAVEAYKGALGTTTYKNKGLALQNLGLAYYGSNDYAAAIRSFDEATNLYNYSLSPVALAALEASRTSLVAFANEAPAEDTEQLIEPSIVDISVEEPVDASPELDLVAISPEVVTADIPILAADLAGQVTNTFDNIATEDSELPFSIGNHEDVDNFFARSEDDMRKMSKKANREKRKPFGWLKGFLIIVLIIGALAGGLHYAYYNGFGIPTSQEVVSKTLTAYGEGKPYESYWSNPDVMVRQMAAVPVPLTFTIGETQIDGMRAIVTASAVPTSGNKIDFNFSLEREGIGWKIVGMQPTP